MAYPIDVLPDATLAVMQYLRGTSALVPTLIASDHILTQIPVSTTYPYILVQWAGGKGIWPALEDAAIQIDVLGGTQPQCNQIARTVRAAIWAIANDVVAAGTLVSGADEMPPSWMPDTVSIPTLSRYTARYRIILH